MRCLSLFENAAVIAAKEFGKRSEPPITVSPYPPNKSKAGWRIEPDDLFRVVLITESRFNRSLNQSFATQSGLKADEARTRKNRRL